MKNEHDEIKELKKEIKGLEEVTLIELLLCIDELIIAYEDRHKA